MKSNFEVDVRAHGLSVGDNDFVGQFVVPAVQFHTPAATQQHLSVHLDRGSPSELSACEVRVVGRVDIVVRKRLVHVLVHFQLVVVDRRVFV